MEYNTRTFSELGLSVLEHWFSSYASEQIETDRQTDIPITILRTPSPGRPSNYTTLYLLLSYDYFAVSPHLRLFCPDIKN